MKELEEQVMHCRKLIKQSFDFNLTWQEVFGLRHYLKCFAGRKGDGEKIDYQEIRGEALHLFLWDYFDIDTVGLGRTAMKDRKAGFREVGLGFMSNSYRSEESLRSYCKSHVDEWRNERISP